MITRNRRLAETALGPWTPMFTQATSPRAAQRRTWTARLCRLGSHASDTQAGTRCRGHCAGVCAEGTSRVPVRPRRERRSFEASASPPSLMRARRQEETPRAASTTPSRGRGFPGAGCSSQGADRVEGFALDNADASHLQGANGQTNWASQAVLIRLTWTTRPSSRR